MNKATLVIMAAGIGSRFGEGIKQLEPVGPNGEIIMDYSIYDALEAGFDKVVFVIRKDLEEDFKRIIGQRIEKVVSVEYVYQEIEDIPEKYKNLLENRKKPWGTGQAILACKNIVKEPFLVINADDYYGKQAYKEAYAYLTLERERGNIQDICMVGFVLGNTLSENGTVTRGICHVDENGMLQDVKETYEIKRDGESAVGVQDNEEICLPLSAAVSMNMWGLQPEFIDTLEKGFNRFLAELKQEDVKGEYLLPQIVEKLLKKKAAQVKVLESHDKWFGVTYKKDKEFVVVALQNLINSGVYPEKLFD